MRDLRLPPDRWACDRFYLKVAKAADALSTSAAFFVNTIRVGYSIVVGQILVLVLLTRICLSYNPA